MSNASHQEQWITRFKRLSASGWLSLFLTLVAAPFVYYAIHFWWGIDWFYTAILGAILSVILSHIILLPILLVFLRWLFPALFCAVCPACGQRAIRLGFRICEPTSDPKLFRVYCEANCNSCRRHFHRFDDGTYTEQSGTN